MRAELINGDFNKYIYTQINTHIENNEKMVGGKISLYTTNGE